MTLWCVLALAATLLAAGVGAALHLGVRDEVLRLRERVTGECSAHYETWRRLVRRERQIGRLQAQVRELREIAESAALLAQLDALVADSAFGPLPEDGA